jgi:hypothetical protein
MQGRMGRIGIEEESENDSLLFALQTLTLPPDHLNDGRREEYNDWVFRRIAMKRAPYLPPPSLCHCRNLRILINSFYA